MSADNAKPRGCVQGQCMIQRAWIWEEQKKPFSLELVPSRWPSSHPDPPLDGLWPLIFSSC